MASLLFKIAKSQSKVNYKLLIPTIQAFREAHWNKDWKPSGYPLTPEERAAAAKKYGLLPEDYEPYPNDGNGLGDYPKLPDISMESKDPYYPYDFPELKRNFGEPLHAEFDLIDEYRYDISGRLRYPMWVYWATFLGVMSGFIGLFYFMEDYKLFRPVAEKQMPGRGAVHYTFEPES